MDDGAGVVSAGLLRPAAPRLCRAVAYLDGEADALLADYAAATRRTRSAAARSLLSVALVAWDKHRRLVAAGAGPPGG